MIYGQDEPMLFPVADLYDSAMMQMYINAAREQYNQNREDMKEFRKLYGDFTSPFAEDIAWVDQQTRGRVNDALNYMQANGIDPLRSAEGRALIQRVINETNVAGINKRKENAKLGEEYLKNMSDMIKNGTYSRDAEKFFLNEAYGIDSYDQFNSDMGMWKRTSPTKYQDLYQATDHIFKDIKPTDLGLDPTGKYRLTGVSEDQLNEALDKNLVGFLGTDMGRYYYNTVKDQLKAQNGGIEPSTEETTAALRSLILSTNNGRIYSTPEADPYALDSARTANDMKAYKEKAAIDHYYHEKEAIAAYERGTSKGQKGKQEYNIFRTADSEPLNTIGYVPANSRNYKIDPIVNGVNFVSNGDGSYYSMTGKQAGQCLYGEFYQNNNGDIVHQKYNKFIGKNYRFFPSGQIKSKEYVDSNGKKYNRYYITGILQSAGEDAEGNNIWNTVTENDGSRKIFEMEVKERTSNHGQSYGKKQQ